MAELISVIVPAYNAERYIARCIQSIENQTQQELEIIVVNDGSVDGTAAKAGECARGDSRIKLLFQENQGVSAARNRGLEEAKGQYIAFVDADDTLPSGALEHLLEVMRAENADIVSGTMRAIHSNGTVREENDASAGIWCGKTALEKSLGDEPHTYSACGKLFRKSFLGGIRFTEKRRIHEDSFFLFECFQKEPRMVCLQESVYEYHIMPDSASRSEFSEKYFDILYFAECKYETIQRDYPQYGKMAKNMRLKANMAFLKMLARTRGTEFRQEEKKCIREIKEGKNDFLPATDADRKWFFVIQHDLYYVYKGYCRGKLWLKNRRNRA